MATIKYTFNDGTSREAEVSEELYLQHLALLQAEKRNHWKETRRHESFEIMQEQGYPFASDEDNPLTFLIERENQAEYITKMKKLKKAMSTLLPEQQKLLTAVFFRNESLSEIARKENVSKQAIHDRLKKIYKKIKKLLI